MKKTADGMHIVHIEVHVDPVWIGHDVSDKDIEEFALDALARSGPCGVRIKRDDDEYED